MTAFSPPLGRSANVPRAKRPRATFDFRLDLSKPDELALADALLALKAKRRFLPTVRLALRLALDLDAGNLAILTEFFPWAVKLPTPPVAPAPDPRPVFTSPAPALGDLLAGVEVRKAKSEQIPWMNTVIAVKRLNGGDWWADLAPEVFDYARRMGKLPAQAKPKPKTPPSGGGGPRKMAGADIQFSAPNFDDLDLKLGGA